MDFNTKYDHAVVDGITFVEPTLAKQAFKDECDINNIIESYQTTGLCTHVTSKSPLYGDFSNVPDYQAAQDTLILAQEQFDALPAKVRKRFDNDPARMLEFMQDESNRDEAIALGLVNKSSVEDGKASSVIGDASVSSGDVSGGSTGVVS